VNSVCNQSGYQMQENVYHCILSVRKNSFCLWQCFHMTFGLHASYYSAVSCNKNRLDWDFGVIYQTESLTSVSEKCHILSSN